MALGGAYLGGICEDLFCLGGDVSYGVCVVVLDKIRLASRIRRSASRWRTAEWSGELEPEPEPPACGRVDAQFPIDIDCLSAYLSRTLLLRFLAGFTRFLLLSRSGRGSVDSSTAAERIAVQMREGGTEDRKEGRKERKKEGCQTRCCFNLNWKLHCFAALLLLHCGTDNGLAPGSGPGAVPRRKKAIGQYGKIRLPTYGRYSAATSVG